MGCAQGKHEKENKKMTQEEKERLEKIASRAPIRKVYNLVRVLGTGGFGTVKLAHLKSNLNSQVAIKIINIHKINDKAHMLLRELDILRSLDHPNIIKFYEVYQDKDFFYICMEYCSGKELLERIYKKKVFKEREAAGIIKKVISAVNHMHKKGIVHRDLKLENILFASNDPDAEIKIIDFGLSNKLQQKKLATMVGTPYYVAPEILSQKPYDEACDMWSVGVILYILLSGSPPFMSNNRTEMYRKIENCLYTLTSHEWNKVSPTAKDLIQKLLEKNPKKRLTAAQALQHSWFENYERDRRVSLNTNEDRVDPKILNMLKNFQTVSKFKREVMKIFVNQLNEKEIKILKENFQRIDKDNTGLIRLHELQQALQESNVNLGQEEISNIMSTISPDNDNGELSIRYSEFIAACIDQRKYLTNEKIKGLFSYFDPTNSNCITAKDLKEIFKRNGRTVSDKDIKQMINEVDPNNDGKLSYEEFLQIMKGDMEEVINVNDPDYNQSEHIRR